MCTVHDEYDLKHSRIAIVFQILFFMIIAWILFLLISAWLVIFSLLVMLLVLFLFHQQPKLQKIARLDPKQWSLQFQNKLEIETVQLNSIIEHYFYVVLYFEKDTEHKKPRSVLIWKDQVTEKAWKRLLIHANI